MDNRFIKASTLKSIADAIRAKKGTSSPVSVADFAEEIKSIVGGGGDPWDEDFTIIGAPIPDDTDGKTIGAWALNDDLTVPSKSFNLAFISNGYEYGAIEYDDSTLYFSVAMGDKTVPAYSYADKVWIYSSDSVSQIVNVFEEPEDADASRWLETNGIKVGGSRCINPHVYHASSADDLPTDAVDGSLAVVTENTQSKKFVFNDELDLSTFVTNGQMCFVSGGIEYDNMKKLAQGSSSWGIYALAYADAHNQSNLYAYTYNPTGDYGFTHGWADEAYKTVDIIYANEYVLPWIEANSTYAGIGDFVLTKTTLYSRENGEWVSKGEI